MTMSPDAGRPAVRTLAAASARLELTAI
jgi:hypothetical protein